MSNKKVPQSILRDLKNINYNLSLYDLFYGGMFLDTNIIEQYPVFRGMTQAQVKHYVDTHTFTTSGDGYYWPNGYLNGCTVKKGLTADDYEETPFGALSTKWNWYCSHDNWFTGNCDFWKRSSLQTAYCNKYPSYTTFGVKVTPELQTALSDALTTCEETKQTLAKYKTYIPKSLAASAQKAINVVKSYDTIYAHKSSNPAQLLISPIGTTLSDITTAQANCASYTQQIKQYAVDDCSNPDTLIDPSNTCMYNPSEGMTTMREGLDTTGQTLDQVYAETLAQSKASYAASQNALNSINPKYASPQLQNKSPNPNPTDVDSILKGYAEYTMGDDTKTLKTVRGDLKKHIAYTSTIYNDCTNSYSLLDMSGVEKCLPNYYNAANSTCTYANNLAISTGDTSGGMKKIPKLWEDAKNSLPGNTIINNKQILTHAKDQCTNWVQMYDKWQEDKQRAEDLPCIPERSIEPAFNPVIQKIVENWSNASENYINSLLVRLRVIEKYIENYPNILELKGKNVQSLPPGQPPYFTISRELDPATPEVSPTFSLHIDMPEGPPGNKGKPGSMGSNGPRGRKGMSGAQGKPGKWEVPIQYTTGQ